MAQNFLSLGSPTRDVLGTIGDALLVGSGDKPIYAPRLKQQRINDALANYQADPQGAIKNYLAIDAPGAIKMAQTQEKADDTHKLAGAKLDTSNLKLARDANAAAIGALGGATDQASYDKALDDADRLYSRFGVSLRDHAPATYPGPEGMRNLLLGVMDADKQLSAMDRGRRLDWDVQNGEADNARANRSLDSSIADRAARRALTVRGQNMTDARGRRGQDMTDARVRNRAAAGGDRGGSGGDTYKIGDTASSPDGRKVVWNGRGWVPARN